MPKIRPNPLGAEIVTSFADNAFTIFDEANVTKLIAFDVGANVSASTTRTLTIQDVNGVLTLQSSAGFTQGSVPFIDANGLLEEDNSNLFWDDTSDRLGIGTASPSTDLELAGDGIITGPSSSVLTLGLSNILTAGNWNFYTGGGSQGHSWNVGAGVELMRLTSAGLRIGTAGAASDTLDVDGTANISGITSFGDDTKLTNAKFHIFDKASGNGIKVDTTTPTFGWRDLLGDQFAKNTGGTKPLLAQYNGAIDAWQFGTGDEAFLTFHIPHDYVPGTDIHLHIHWSQTYDSVTGGDVDFKYSAIYAKGHNQASFGAPITGLFSSIVLADGGLDQYRHHLTEVVISAATATVALFDRDDLEPDGVIELTFEMVANNLTGVAVTDPFIHYVDIHYQSTNIATKEKAPDFYA